MPHLSKSQLVSLCNLHKRVSVFSAIKQLTVENATTKFIVLYLFFSVTFLVAFAQPTVLGTQAVNGTYTTYNLNSIGLLKQCRVQATSSGLLGTRNWEFATGTAASPSYTTNWRPYTTPTRQMAATNAVLSSAASSGALYNTSSGGVSGMLPAVTANNYYTFNVQNNAAASNAMQVLETNYNPASIGAVSQTPIAGSVSATNYVAVNFTTSTTPAVGENVYVRYSTSSSFTTSTISQASFVGALGTAYIPCSAVTIYYYVYSSNKTLAQINADVVSVGEVAHDLNSLQIVNNAGANYSYTITAPTTNFSGTYFVPSSCYPTLAGFIIALNAGTVTGAVTVNVAAGYTETAPNGGYSITQTGTSTNTIVFQKYGAGAKPVFNSFFPQTSNVRTDAVFKLIGADYVTIDGFILQENALNTTTSTMTEFGVALFYANTTNGAQNNTIQNCTITLNKINVNTVGIYSNVRHTATNVTSTADISNFTGSNSSNKYYGNSITNANIGIALVGSSNGNYHDVGNDIGGTAIGTGNTIIGWGENSSNAGYVSLNQERFAIYMNHQKSDNISFNTLVSGNITGATNLNIRGVFKDYTNGQPNGTFTSSINNNTFTITDNFTTTTANVLQAIGNYGITTPLATATMNMNNNIVTGCSIGAASTKTQMQCIFNNSVIGVLNMNGNTFTDNVSGVNAGGFEALDNSANVITAISMSNNQMGTAAKPCITFTNPIIGLGATSGVLVYLINPRYGASTCALNVNNNVLSGMNVVYTSNVGYVTAAGINISSTFVGNVINVNNNNFGTSTRNFITYTSALDNGSLTPIYNGGGSATCVTSITGNDFTGISDITGAATPEYFIYNHTTALAYTLNISNNTFTNLNLKTANGVLFIYNNFAIPVGGSQTINNNSIVGTFNKPTAGGYLYCYYSNTASPAGTSFNFTNNNFSNIYLTGATSLFGLFNGDGASSTSAPAKKIRNNNYNNWNAGTNSVVGLYANNFGSSIATISQNSLTNFTSNGEIDGIFLGTTANSGIVKIDSNVVNNFSGAGFSAAIYSGSPAAEIGINQNTITNINSTNTTSSLFGISTGPAAKQIVHRNQISKLTGANFVSGIFTSASGVTSNLIDSNQVYELKNNSTANNTNIYGIGVYGANSVDIVANDIYNFVTSSTNAGTGANSAIVAISNNTSAVNNNTRNNKIYDLKASNTTSGNISVVALATALNTAGGNINNNRIFKLFNSNTGATASAVGFCPQGGNWTTYNNMISISNEINNNPLQCLGICDAGDVGSRNYYFNSIHIGGNATPGTTNSTALQYNSAGNNVKIINNLLNVVRTGSGKNFAIANLGSTYTGFTSNYNVMNVVVPSDAGATVGFASNSVPSWVSSTGSDAQSNAGLTVNFVDPLNGDLHVTTGNICNVRGLGQMIPTTLVDIDAQVRKNGVAPNGPDVGADEVFKALAWTGTTNQSWTNAANWAGGTLPNPNSDVVIPNVLNQPIINTGDNIQINSITVSTGASVTNNGSLGITDYVSATNNLDCQNGKLLLNSPCNKQTISGTSFVNKSIKDLVIGSTVIISAVANDTLKVLDNLSFDNVNNKTLVTNDNLTLVSTNTRTANLNDLTNNGANPGNTVSGKVNIERYMFARKSWRLLATPIVVASSPSISAAWRENNSALTSFGYGTQITGPSGAGGGMDATSPRASMKSYNGAVDNFIDITNTSTPIANENGYFVFVRGDRGVSQFGLGATNLRIKGEVRTGNQLFTVLPNKYQCFGNPYPSRINFKTVDKTNIVNSFTVWNPNSPGLYNVGAYETYTFDGTNYVKPGGAIRNYIESGEAVFVQSNSTSAGSVLVKETDKNAGSDIVSRMGVSAPTLEILLYAKETDNSSYLADGVMINFKNNYSAEIDNNDVRKSGNVADNLSIKKANYNLVVERRPEIIATDTIKMSLTGTRVAAYRLDIDPSVLANSNLEAQLVDNFLQSSTAVDMNAITSYPFNITTDAASKAADRFMIVFKKVEVTNFTTIAAKRNADKTVTVTFGTANEKNVSNYTVEQSNDGINFTALISSIAPLSNVGGNINYSKIDVAASKANNWYRVKMNNINSPAKYTSIAMVNAIKEENIAAIASINVYPNPVQNGNINLHLTNQAEGVYLVSIMTINGQTIYTEQIKVQSNIVNKQFKIEGLAAGNYKAVITKSDGSKTTLSIFAQ
jgi:hypothetical protein